MRQLQLDGEAVNLSAPLSEMRTLASDASCERRENTMSTPILSLDEVNTEVVPAEPWQKPVCRTCGSDEVVSDAYAAWNVDRQEWEVSATFDKGATCEKCGGETRLKWVDL